MHRLKPPGHANDEKVNRLKLTHRIGPVKQETYSNFVIIGCVSLWLNFLFAECYWFFVFYESLAMSKGTRLSLLTFSGTKDNRNDNNKK